MPISRRRRVTVKDMRAYSPAADRASTLSVTMARHVGRQVAGHLHLAVDLIETAHIIQTQSRIEVRADLLKATRHRRWIGPGMQCQMDWAGGPARTRQRRNIHSSLRRVRGTVGNDPDDLVPGAGLRARGRNRPDPAAEGIVVADTCRTNVWSTIAVAARRNPCRRTCDPPEPGRRRPRRRTGRPDSL
jgi:hypothetical protein